MNSPFFPPPIGTEPGRANESPGCACSERRHFFPLNRWKIILEVLSIFVLLRDFLNKNTQATISAFRLLKNTSINPGPNQWKFTSATLYYIRFVVYPNIKDNERNQDMDSKSLFTIHSQDLSTIENTNSDLKVRALHYANELLVRVRLSFQKLLKTIDSKRLDWKLARVTGSNMVEIRDVTVSSERHFNFCSTAQ